MSLLSTIVDVGTCARCGTCLNCLRGCGLKIQKIEPTTVPSYIQSWTCKELAEMTFTWQCISATAGRSLRRDYNGGLNRFFCRQKPRGWDYRYLVVGTQLLSKNSFNCSLVPGKKNSMCSFSLEIHPLSTATNDQGGYKVGGKVCLLLNRNSDGIPLHHTSLWGVGHHTIFLFTLFYVIELHHTLIYRTTLHCNLLYCLSPYKELTDEI